MGLKEFKRLTLIPLIAFSLSVLTWQLSTSLDDDASETAMALELASKSKSLAEETIGVRGPQALWSERHESAADLRAKSPVTSQSNPGAGSLILARASNSSAQNTARLKNHSPVRPAEAAESLDDEPVQGRFVEQEKSEDSLPTDDATVILPEIEDEDSVEVALREPPVLQDPRQIGAPGDEVSSIPVFSPGVTNNAFERSFPRNLPSWIEDSMKSGDSTSSSASNVDVHSLFQELCQYGTDAVVLTPDYLQLWQARLQDAKTLAQEGALFAAEQRVEELLLELASTLDGKHECAVHQALVNAGLLALHESRDFSSDENHGSETDWLRRVAGSHKTQVNSVHDAQRLTAVEMQQAYYDFSIQMLIWGCGHQAIAADAMFVLGRIHQISNQVGNQELGQIKSTVAVPAEVVYYQIAIALNPQHALAANELGVLLGQLGDWESARDVLLQSVVAHPTVESWQNLAEVHRRLGEPQLANLATNEARLMQSQRQSVVQVENQGVSEKAAATAQQQPRIWANR